MTTINIPALWAGEAATAPGIPGAGGPSRATGGEAFAEHLRRAGTTGTRPPAAGRRSGERQVRDSEGPDRRRQKAAASDETGGARETRDGFRDAAAGLAGQSGPTESQKGPGRTGEKEAAAGDEPATAIQAKATDAPRGSDPSPATPRESSDAGQGPETNRLTAEAAQVAEGLAETAGAGPTGNATAADLETLVASLKGQAAQAVEGRSAQGEVTADAAQGARGSAKAGTDGAAGEAAADGPGDDSKAVGVRAVVQQKGEAKAGEPAGASGVATTEAPIQGSAAAAGGTQGAQGPIGQAADGPAGDESQSTPAAGAGAQTDRTGSSGPGREPPVGAGAGMIGGEGNGRAIKAGRAQNRETETADAAQEGLTQPQTGGTDGRVKAAADGPGGNPLHDPSKAQTAAGDQPAGSSKGAKEGQAGTAQTVQTDRTDAPSGLAQGQSTAGRPDGTTVQGAGAADGRTVQGGTSKVTAETARPDPAEIIKQIVARTNRQGTREGGEIRIQLKPDYLGPLNLRVTLERGALTAHLVTQSQRVKEAIEAGLPQLKQALEDQGLRTDQIAVSLGNDSFSAQLNGQGRGAWGQRAWGDAEWSRYPAATPSKTAEGAYAAGQPAGAAGQYRSDGHALNYVA